MDGHIEDGNKRLDCRHVVAVASIVTPSPSSSTDDAAVSPTPAGGIHNPGSNAGKPMPALIPELRSALRRVVPMAPLTTESARIITSRKCEDLGRRLAAWQGVILQCSAQAVDALSEWAIPGAPDSDRAPGCIDGHHIADTVRQMVELPLIDEMCRQSLSGQRVLVDLKDHRLHFIFE